MIKYSLKCDQDHVFDSWFQSAEAFDTLKSAGHLTCAICGSSHVEKAMMVPQIAPARKTAVVPAKEKPSLSEPASEMERAMAELRKKVEENSVWVGKDFAQEARAIHSGDAPDRPIWGEAKFSDAKALVEDGVPVAPLPFGPKSKAN